MAPHTKLHNNHISRLLLRCYTQQLHLVQLSGISCMQGHKHMCCTADSRLCQQAQTQYTLISCRTIIAESGQAHLPLLAGCSWPRGRPMVGFASSSEQAASSSRLEQFCLGMHS